jgi:hypothetical protein
MSEPLTWHLRLPERLYERIAPLAASDGRTPPNLARHLLEQAADAFHERKALPRRDGRSRK